ncbi:MAG: class I tRNA ligase family protein [Candidatus Taylorbacteria bacterium]|nr:class I tRNA ligase family protein [Candidatus Taylorbacteria bacterium]
MEKKKSEAARREEEILKFWEKNKIFEKTLKKEAPKGEFVFYDGPPFANGAPHFGNFLASIIKDVIPRYKTMRGYGVPRRWGWDCHGLPVETEVEKELRLPDKKAIEEFGVERFNEAAAKSVMRYAAVWREQIPRVGRWVDMERDYRTMDTPYTESVWWIFKTLYDKGLIYEGFKAMHLCPRCGTTLSNFEVGQRYKSIKDLSAYVKFPLKGQKDTYLLAWTTTPWTLPGNAALAVRPDARYMKIKVGPEKLILAKDRAGILETEYEIVEEFWGRELLGLEYHPPFDYFEKDKKAKNRERAWRIYGADFVTLKEGAGIVHIAPAFGDDDLSLAEKEDIPLIHHVTPQGNFAQKVLDFAGLPVKPKSDPQAADKLIVEHLKNKNLIFKVQEIVHEYPHCWRCETPLLNFASSSWFVKVIALKNKLLSENRKIKWVPPEIGEGRFGTWLEGARDWAVSRSRYFGAPLPVWRCDKCERVRVVGSVAELKKESPPSAEIYIMRHGEAENNVLGILNTNLAENNLHLTAKGREQVRASAAKLRGRFDIIISSPFLRARETAELAAEALGFSKDKIIIDERIREYNAGVFDGRRVDEYHAFYAKDEEYFSKRPEGGENYTDVRKRVGEFLYEAAGKYIGKQILVVSHDAPLWLMWGVSGGKSVGELLKGEPVSAYFLGNGEWRELDFAPLPLNSHFELDFHRPYIDRITLTCPCGAPGRRVEEVFDCWFESGSMPYASHHYPFGDKALFNPSSGFLRKSVGFPADFIAEGLDQTRGWFYSMLVLGAALFGRSPYKKVLVNGIILAEDGQKMSKRLKNYPDPMAVVDRFGADALRFYLLSSPVVRGEELKFSEKGLGEIQKKVLGRLHNVLEFYELYALKSSTPSTLNPKPSHILDRWILARLSELSKEVTDGLEAYELDRAARPIAEFVDDLSAWYVRRSRERFRGDDKEEKKCASATLFCVLGEFSKLIAPSMPFYAEYIYQRVKPSDSKESVHLESWPSLKDYKLPSADGPSARARQAASHKLLENMKEVRRVVSLALEARARAGIKVRQPLHMLKLKAAAEGFLDKPLLRLVADEVNVKVILPDESISGEVELDTRLTEALREEGVVRDIVRLLQDARKKAGLKVGEKASVSIAAPEEIKRIVEKNKGELIKSATLKELRYDAIPDSEKFQIDGKPVSLRVEKSDK